MLLRGGSREAFNTPKCAAQLQQGSEGRAAAEHTKGPAVHTLLKEAGHSRVPRAGGPSGPAWGPPFPGPARPQCVTAEAWAAAPTGWEVGAGLEGAVSQVRGPDLLPSAPRFASRAGRVPSSPQRPWELEPDAGLTAGRADRQNPQVAAVADAGHEGGRHAG